MLRILFIFTMYIILTPVNICATDKEVAIFDNDFIFGLATAPAHSEDNLDDMWLEYALMGKIKAFSNHAKPEQRLNFYSEPEVELDLAQKSGAGFIRLGVDWGRLAPFKPGSDSCMKFGQSPCGSSVQDIEALYRYREIFKMTRQKGLKIMLTLFHHSLPKWAFKMGGWKNKKIKVYFEAFSLTVIDFLKDYVDYIITFNEPTTYSFLTNIAGLWPNTKNNPLEIIIPLGNHNDTLLNMANAHAYIYEKSRRFNIPIGFANNVAIITPSNYLSIASSIITKYKFNHEFSDMVAKYIDFIGINYYGEEIISPFSLKIDPTREYSESGRTIYPKGLFTILEEFHKRYNKSSKYRETSHDIPFIITENGISDSTDILRPSYLIEHLIAINEAIKSGIPVKGYFFWTISDNWEWADGYCPKFGLTSVERDNELKRNIRPSFYLFKKIATTKKVSFADRDKAWQKVQNNIGEYRPFCRSKDGRTSLDYPSKRRIKSYDWRFKK